MQHTLKNPNAPSAFTYAWIGPFVGAAVRPIGGWISDKVGGSIVTQVISAVMVVASVAVGYVMMQAYGSATPEQYFPMFLGLFIVLFVASGIGNGSTFRTIGVIFDRTQAGPVLGWTSAIAAYGAFVAPIVIGDQIKAGTPQDAMYGFAIFYALCLVLNWWFYLRAQRLREEPLSRNASRHAPACTHHGRRAGHRPLEPRGSGVLGAPVAAASRARNLWLSIPALMLAFAVWMVWSRGGRAPAGSGLPLLDQPAVLARRAAGAVRAPRCASSTPSWCRSSAAGASTALATASLLLPALGIGFAVQRPGHAVRGDGRAGAAVRPRRRQLRQSRMAQHQLLLPDRAQGLRAGPERRPGQPGRVARAVGGAAGRSRRGIFGALGGAPQAHRRRATPMWLQNAGFVWVPFIARQRAGRLARHGRPRPTRRPASPSRR